jgi:hypothetical protein
MMSETIDVVPENVVYGRCNNGDAKRKLIKLNTGEWYIGMVFPEAGDDGRVRIDKPMNIQMIPQGPGRINFALFPAPCSMMWIDQNAIIGEGDIAQGIENQYIQATTGIQMAMQPPVAQGGHSMQ